MSSSNPDLNVSLKPHLLEVLEPLPLLLPPQLADQLKIYISTPNSETSKPKTIPYPLLSSISQWSRTPSGLKALSAQTPPLDPQSYTIISLLAGSITSPERKFPKYVPKEDEEQVARKRAVSDRKAITTLVNALLSVAGSGFATWWAADRLNWRNEWRVLLSLFVATVVAISEAVLFIIWDSRKSGKLARKARQLKAAAVKLKQDDEHSQGIGTIMDDQASSQETQLHVDVDGLRHRAVVTNASTAGVED